MNVKEHLYVLLAEEAAEVAQACAKVLRFGPDEIYEGPTNPERKTNAQRCMDELRDMRVVINMLQVEGLLSMDGNDQELYKAKAEKIAKYMFYSRRLGTIK